MPRKQIQRIQDSLHGLMEFRGMETNVLDILRTPEIQRMRRIRQLGLACFVYPGAEHSRLVHSIGASYLSILFGRHLKNHVSNFPIPELRPKEDDIRNLAVAALCHDLGHGPLSHVWELVIRENYNIDDWLKVLKLEEEKTLLEGKKWHELITYAFLLWEDGQLHQLLESFEEGFSKRIAYFLSGIYHLSYLPMLISGDVDVDRADFILRDTFQSGVAYGKCDFNWLLSTSSIGDSNNVLVICFDERKAIRVVEQFLIVRRSLYEMVYYHKTVRCIEGMVLLFLQRLKEVMNDNKELYMGVSKFLHPIVEIISGKPLTQNDLLKLDDYSLWMLIGNIIDIEGVDDTVRDLGRRILSRDLFKIVPCDSDKIEMFLQQEGGREKILKRIQQYCPGENKYYLYVDKTEFSILNEDSKYYSYFLSENNIATPIKDYFSRKNPGWLDKKRLTKIFTLQEAIDSVKELIDDSLV